MKKCFVLALLGMFMSSAGLFAQESTFGVRVGPSFTTLGGEEGGDGSKFRIGYHFGVYGNFAVSESFSFEPGLQFASKGASADEGLGPGVTASIRNGYLDIPLLLKFQVAEQFFLFFGPQPSFLLASAFEIKDGNNNITISGSEAKNLWKDFDFAGVVGFGSNFGDGFNIQLSYEHGFANISDISDSFYNRGFKLSLGKSF
ncbi:porin family protein [Pararhodonellum marinum]|uniref:porin family protein n=1 Tax=Pararhodonellum marinum TaxID=2755358 RepID=UPI00188F9B56|nr:porin family protein [Pararhodonellum marinum]